MELELIEMGPYLTEAESSSFSNFDENAHQIIWINFRTALIASSTSTSDESLDTMPTRVAAAESKEFACKPGHVWTATVPSATQTLTQNLVLQNSVRRGDVCRVKTNFSSRNHCRFDVSSTRAARIKCDKFAAFLDFWTKFQTNSRNLHKPAAFSLVTSRCHQQARSFLPPHCSHVPRYLSTVRYWPPLFPSFLPRALTMPLRQQNNNNTDQRQPPPLSQRPPIQPKHVANDNPRSHQTYSLTGEIYVGRQPGRERSVVAINVVKSIGESNQQLPTVSYIPKRKKCVLLLCKAVMQLFKRDYN
ncbi:hypothetical protein T4A_5517 [Trichinella pseudospiralis]|uniref:Uncharacterized protein n=1 Tax=Trichinella pseudospiralis TaxID=6337 RepID=A0A0V1DUT1_TRIPS|nr:hypothetical protein T4A_5517 [Trichinella pseudospiralis]